VLKRGEGLTKILLTPPLTRRTKYTEREFKRGEGGFDSSSCPFLTKEGS
jgi:hypothetical protein